MSSHTVFVAAAVLLAAAPLPAQQAAPAPITLGGAARLAAERGGATAAARARSAQADARVAQHRADFLPSLSSSAQAGARTFNTASLGLELPTAPGGSPLFDAGGEVMGPVRTVDFRTELSQRVLDVPALFRWRAAAAGAEAERFTAEAAAEAAATRGATAYLRVLHAEARIAARAADSALAAELLDMARQQVQAGVGIALDVTRAESQLADARARLIATRGQRDQAVLQLRRELALDADAPLALADSLAAPPADEPAPAADALGGALARRADFQAARAQRQGARLDERAAGAGRLPTLSVFADHGTVGKNTDHLLGTYSYGVRVTLPVFDGLRLEARSAEERARRREAEARLADARRAVETDVRSATIAVATARERVAAARARLGLAEQEVAQARERFRNGVSSNADVITASITLNGARDQLIDALTDYHLARVSLASARGATTTLP